MKPYPLGIQTFGKIIEGEFWYIDNAERHTIFSKNSMSFSFVLF